MTTAVFRVSGVSTQTESVRARLPMSRIVRGDVVLASPLDPALPLNDHLVWLWGMLRGERRFLKALAGDGAILTCECTVQRGAIRLQPNSAEMLHLLGAELAIEAK